MTSSAHQLRKNFEVATTDLCSSLPADTQEKLLKWMREAERFVHLTALGNYTNVFNRLREEINNRGSQGQ